MAKTYSTSTVASRYEIGYDGLECLDHVSSLSEAFRLARIYFEREPDLLVFVFDRMAKKRYPCLWFFSAYHPDLFVSACRL